MNRMSKNTNTQNSAPHRILNSPRFVSKMKHMNQISKDTNAKWIKWHKWVKVPTNKLRRHKTYFKFITICTQNTSNDSNEQKYQRIKFVTKQSFKVIPICTENKSNDPNQWEYQWKKNKMTQMSENTNRQHPFIQKRFHANLGRSQSYSCLLVNSHPIKNGTDLFFYYWTYLIIPSTLFFIIFWNPWFKYLG